MAGNTREARKYVFLLFISVFYPLGFHLKEEPTLGKAEIVYFFNYKGNVVNGKSLGFLKGRNSGSSTWF